MRVSTRVATGSGLLVAVLAGLVLSWIGYGGLALVALVIVVTVTVLAPYARRG